MTATRSDAIVVQGVTKHFKIDHEKADSLKGGFTSWRRRHTTEDFLALSDVTFSVPQGSICGVLGANGSGKSTLLKCMARILVPDEGHVTIDGRVASLLELGTGFHSDLSGRENVHLNGSLLGLSKREIADRFDEIVNWSELAKFIDNPIKTYSSGMRVRLGFAVATTVDADVLLLDEVLAVGDLNFRKKSRARLDRLLSSGCTIVLVAHDLTTLSSLCDIGVVLDHGRVAADGPIDDAIAAYQQLMEAEASATAARDQAPSGVLLGAEALHDDEVIDPRRWADPLVLRVHVDAARCPEDGRLMISLRNREGVMVSYGPVRGALDDLPLQGIVEIDVALGPFPLVDGRYSISVAVRGTEPTRVVDQLPNAARLVAKSSPPRESPGVLPLDASWTRREAGADLDEPLTPGPSG